MLVEKEWSIAVPEVFQFQENLHYLANANHECMYQVVKNEIIKAIKIDDVVFLMVLREATSGGLLVKVVKSSCAFSEAYRDKITTFVSEWFDVNTNLAGFYKIALKDPYLKSLVQTHYGLRLIGIPNFFEAISWAIIGQQINLSFAYKLKRRIVERYGTSVQWNERLFWLFPTPEVIANISVSELTSLQLSKRKSEYIIDMARAIVCNEISKEKLLATNSLEEAEKMLTAYRGIGSWTAHYVLMRCLRVPNAFPIADVGLQNAIKQVVGLKQKPTKEYVREIGTNWANWQAYATFYLWRSIYQ
ncbi:DNA-3-methyladenine glycosylase family protein [Virgibacillus dokdonensis]|uniref:DNA-3-methyladenine glycosylase family protein n=1 Tax=Virgibacillus dokdonensis TaxID=302167 RepID=UPI00098B4F26|nr:DNA-3-methyladenine glycosylase [Virgibacillus dokdonensis]